MSRTAMLNYVLLSCSSYESWRVRQILTAERTQQARYCGCQAQEQSAGGHHNCSITENVST